MHGSARKCAVEHRDKHNPDLERLNLGSVNDRNLQRDGKHDTMPLQVRLGLHLGRFGMYQHKNSIMHGASLECKLEHSFKHNADMERFKLDSNNNGKLQRDGKHDTMPLQVRLGLHLGRFGMYQHKNSFMHGASGKCTVEHSFKHNTDVERQCLDSDSNRQF